MQLQLSTDAAGVEATKIRATRLRGHEGISELFEYELFVGYDVDEGLSDENIAALMDKPISLSFAATNAGDEDASYLHGIIREVELCATAVAQPVPYRLVIVPALWELSLTKRSRVFVEKTVEEIARTIFESHGWTERNEFELALSPTYTARPFVFQYEESDLAFLSRIFEHWGIWYCFEHRADTTVMVIGDHNQDFTTDPHTVRFAPGAGNDPTASVLLSLTRSKRMTHASIRTSDYHWQIRNSLGQPNVTRGSNEAPIHASGRGVWEMTAENAKDKTELEFLADIRKEELAAHSVTFSGTCNLPTLSPGHYVSLTDHVLVDLVDDYLITSIQHDMRIGGSEESTAYRKTFTAIPKQTTYRPQRRTAKPRIHGILPALVLSANQGMVKAIDDEGCYRVCFCCDLFEHTPQTGSFKVRRMQQLTGHTFGIHFPLHVGAEVGIAFIYGDPDRPVIVAAMPNAESLSHVTDAIPTQSQIKTKSGIHIRYIDQVE